MCRAFKLLIVFLAIVASFTQSQALGRPAVADSSSRAITQPACAGASQWFKASMHRVANSSLLQEELLLDLQTMIANQGMINIDIKTYFVTSVSLEQMATAQRSATFPEVAAPANKTLADRYSHLSSAMKFLIQASIHSDGSESQVNAMEAMSEEVSEARRLGVSAIPLVRQVIDACGLSGLPEIEAELSCFSVSEIRASRGYQLAGDVLGAVFIFEELFWNSIENGDLGEARRLVSQSLFESWLGQLDLVADDDVGSDFVAATTRYVMATLALASAELNQSDQAAYDTAYTEYERATFGLQEYEATLLARCDPLLGR